MKIPFNKPYFSGREIVHIEKSFSLGRVSGDGEFTGKCQSFFEKNYGFQKALLTTSCTDALEMASILCNISPGDEVIAPSYTFVSTVNAFALRGAKIVFVDSENAQPNIDVNLIEPLITARTKAIVPVHYGGVSCDMDLILDIALRHKIFVIEDAAQAIDSYYMGKPLGSLGDFGAFSFHETKNIISGEGGMLAINNELFLARAEIIREKGTNRAAFFRGEVDKYGSVDIGSSFLPSDIIAAFLYAQLEELDPIQRRRLAIWHRYHEKLSSLQLEGFVQLPFIPKYATNNAHMFYIVCKSLKDRSELIEFLKLNGVRASFHYPSLYSSSYYRAQHDGRKLPNSDRYSDCLLRLPLYYELSDLEVDYVAELIHDYYGRI